MALAIGGYAVAGDVAPATGGRYVEAFVGYPLYLNPLLAEPNTPDEDLSSLVFSGLTRVRADGAVEGDLASSWGVSLDGRTYTFSLRPDARWHDGRAVTSEDVASTFAAIAHSEFPGNPDLAAQWRSVVVEAATGAVRIRLPEPDALFLERASIGIVPAAVARAMRGEAGLSADTNRAPIGSGPFRVVAADRDRIVLEAYAGYHGRAPYLAEFEARFVPTAERALALTRSGDAMSIAPILDDRLPDALPGLTVADLTLASERAVLVFNTRRTPIDEALTRLALTNSLDRVAIARVAGDGGAIGAAAQASDAAFAAAGWQRTPDGPLSRNGARLAVTITTSDRPSHRRAAEEVVRQWNARGAQVEVQTTGWTGFVGDTLAKGAFHVALVRVRDRMVGRDPRALWGASGLLGIGGWGDERVDALARAVTAAPGETERTGARTALNARLEAEAPIVTLYEGRARYVTSRLATTTHPSVLRRLADRFDSIADWHVFTRRAPGRF